MARQEPVTGPRPSHRAGSKPGAGSPFTDWPLPPPIRADVRRRAMLTIAEHATGREDLCRLLDMLGLIR